MSRNKHTASATATASELINNNAEIDPQVGARLESMDTNKDGKLTNDDVREGAFGFGRWSVGRTRALADFQVYVAGAGEPTLVDGNVCIQVRVLTGYQKGQVVNMSVTDIKTLDSREGSARLHGNKVTSELDMVRNLADKYEQPHTEKKSANDKSTVLVLGNGTRVLFYVQKDDSIAMIQSVLSDEAKADRMMAKLNPTTLKSDEPKGEKCLSKRGSVIRLTLAPATTDEPAK